MAEKKIFGALGGLAAIMFLIAVFMPRDKGPDVKDLIAQELAPLSDVVTELGSRVNEVEGSLGELSEQLANAATAEQIADVQSKVDEAMAQTGALSGSLEDMKTTLDETVQAVASAATPQVVDQGTSAEAPQATEQGASAQATPVSDQTASVEATPAEGGTGGSGLGAGQTALFADGNLRLFVSRLDEENQEVRVSVMGEMKTLPVGQGRTMPVGDEYCRVTVSAVTGQGAEFESVCGDDLPLPEGTSAGNTAILADGGLRVFVSRVLEEEARFSINGDMQTVALGQSVSTMAGEEPCRVYLDALDRGHAVVSAKCGAGMAVSDAAGAGSTVLLNEGAVRVFVSSVRDGAVRFAVNGQTLVSGGPDDSVALGDGCAVMVEDVADGTASFSHLCDD